MTRCPVRADDASVAAARAATATMTIMLVFDMLMQPHLNGTRADGSIHILLTQARDGRSALCCLTQGRDEGSALAASPISALIRKRASPMLRSGPAQSPALHPAITSSCEEKAFLASHGLQTKYWLEPTGYQRSRTIRPILRLLCQRRDCGAERS